MLEQEAIDSLRDQLDAHRRRLAYRLHQQARLSDYAPPDVVLDIEEARAEILRLKTQLRDAGLDVRDEPNDTGTTFAAARPMLSLPERRNRERMLSKVHDFWIKGVLEHSLQGATLIGLALEERQEAVIRPWALVVHDTAPAARQPATPVSIVDAFDTQGGELLILGEPGCGKTTLLLELTRALLERASDDVEHPMPVVFNLSSWASRRAPLAAWLVDELNQQYDIPRKIAQAWVNSEQLLPLLDGLDEVRQDQREACVDAINAFRREHGLVNLVVCSRIADYEALAKRLKLQGAVLIQPLTQQQIDAYLSAAGDRLAGLRAALQSDAALRELAETPLGLSIMAWAYQGQSVEQVDVADSIEVQRPRLFDRYIERMFARRGVAQRYSREQTVHWLSWLAQGMLTHQRSIFLIEQLQPSWLPTRATRFAYLAGFWLTICLHSVFIAAILSGGGLASGTGLGLVLLAGAIVGTVWTMAEYLVQRHARSPAAHPLRLSAPVALTICFVIAALVWERWNALAWILSLIILLRLVSGSPDVIKPIDGLRWSWERAARGFGFAFVMLTLSLIVSGLTGAMAVWLHFGRTTSLVAELVSLAERYASLFSPSAILAMTMSIALLAAFLEGIQVTEISRSSRPNDGMRRSIRNAILTLVLGTILATPILGVAWVTFVYNLAGEGNGLEFFFGLNLIAGLPLALILALLVSLARGGAPFLKHVLLRAVLVRYGALPRDYAHFLDSCVERIFLRKIGGGYIFVHRLLLEHFVSLVSAQRSPEEPVGQ